MTSVVVQSAYSFAGVHCDRDQPFRGMGAVAIARGEAVVGRSGVAVVVGKTVEQGTDRADCREVGRVEQQRIGDCALRVCRKREQCVDRQTGDPARRQLPP